MAASLNLIYLTSSSSHHNKAKKVMDKIQLLTTWQMKVLKEIK